MAMTRSHVLLTLLLLCSTASANDWSRDGEFLIDTNAVSLSSQYNPVAAFDGTNYLVVWEDDRNGDWDIFGARIDQNGNVIDPVAIPISVGLNDQKNPAICFCGADYMVVWNDNRNESEPAGDIYGARINQTGIVLDPTGIAISTAAYAQKNPSIAFDGTNFLVVWQDSRNDTFGNSVPDIYGARVNQSGIVLDADGIGIKVDPVDPYWSANDFNPSLCFGGSQYLMVWTYASGPMPDISELFCARIDPSGNIMDTTFFNLAVDPFPNYSVIAFDGTNYLTIWRSAYWDSTGVMAARLDQSGHLLDSVGVSVYWANILCERFPSVAFDGVHYMIVWQDSSIGNFDLYGTRLNTSGIVVDSFPLSLQPGNQITPTIAHGDGSQMLIAYSGWTDSVSGQPVNTMRIWGKFYPFIGVEEGKTSIVEQRNLIATIFRGPLQLPEGRKCKVFDITGRAVKPDRIQPGIYFLEVDGKIVQKVIKVR